MGVKVQEKIKGAGTVAPRPRYKDNEAKPPARRGANVQGANGQEEVILNPIRNKYNHESLNVKLEGLKGGKKEIPEGGEESFCPIGQKEETPESQLRLLAQVPREDHLCQPRLTNYPQRTPVCVRVKITEAPSRSWPIVGNRVGI
jgi:hypothetical protein